MHHPTANWGLPPEDLNSGISVVSLGLVFLVLLSHTPKELFKQSLHYRPKGNIGTVLRVLSYRNLQQGTQIAGKPQI